MGQVNPVLLTTYVIRNLLRSRRNLSEIYKLEIGKIVIFSNHTNSECKGGLFFPALRSWTGRDGTGGVEGQGSFPFRNTETIFEINSLFKKSRGGGEGSRIREGIRISGKQARGWPTGVVCCGQYKY